MNRKFFLIILVTFLVLFYPQTVKAETEVNFVAANSSTLKNEILGIENVDPRIEKLTKFLNFYHSPLAPYAQNFISEADKNQLDWKLVVSITGVESTFGKHIPFNSYNAYGWNNGNYKFNSWPESIVHVSRVLKEKYADRGLTTPEKIAPVYAPPSSTWGYKVRFFMNKLENFDPNSPSLGFDLTI